jgi:hypothetical protein
MHTLARITFDMRNHLLSPKTKNGGLRLQQPRARARAAGGTGVRDALACRWALAVGDVGVGYTTSSASAPARRLVRRAHSAFHTTLLSGAWTKAGLARA